MSSSILPFGSRDGLLMQPFRGTHDMNNSWNAVVSDSTFYEVLGECSVINVLAHLFVPVDFVLV